MAPAAVRTRAAVAGRHLSATRDACVYALGGGSATSPFRRRVLDARHRLRATADQPAGDGRFGRRQEPTRPRRGQERLARSADRGAGRYRCVARLPPRASCAPVSRKWRSTARSSMPRVPRLAGCACPALLAYDGDALAEAISRSCAHKAAIVETRSVRTRRTRAAEFRPRLRPCDRGRGRPAGLNHGEAVAVGMVLAARLSARSAWPAGRRRTTGGAARALRPVRIPPGSTGRAARAHAPGQRRPPPA